MKKIIFTVICIISINMAHAQNVNIPDAMFKTRLVNNAAINTNGDGEIQVSEAIAFSGVIDVSTGATWPFPKISDLTGIEAFTVLTGLDCSNNVLTNLDVSANTALTSLNCGDNQLTSLNVSGNAVLTQLTCRHNSLSSLNISTNTALTTLSCYDNQLTSLNVSANTALTTLSCYDNQLTSLNVSANTALSVLSCSSNQLTSLDVSANTALTVLNCGYNQLTSLDVSANTALIGLDCRNSFITSLDVSANVALVYLYCWNNQLTSLNVQNGNNVNFNTLYATNNPNLTCIQVDDVANANSYTGGTFFKDAVASYSTNCVALSVSGMDISATMQIIPNPANSYVTVHGSNNFQKMEIINMQGQIIKTILVNGNSFLLDVSNIANGIYQLKLSSKKESQIGRLVVAH